MKDYYVSCDKATCLVICDNDNRIMDTAPIWKKFVGQDLFSLTEWLQSKFGSVVVECIGIR